MSRSDSGSGKFSQSSSALPILLCFSHLRWNFVYQRPQHLMSRFARKYRVLFWEEPLVGGTAGLLEHTRCTKTGVEVMTPRIPDGLSPEQETKLLRALLAEALGTSKVDVLWFYTPMMLPLAENLRPASIIYDCMDELANFRNAPPELLSRESELLEIADLVFTGGYSLYEAKRSRHPDVHPFPSSVDKDHFKQAREAGAQPADQRESRSPCSALPGSSTKGWTSICSVIWRMRTPNGRSSSWARW